MNKWIVIAAWVWIVLVVVALIYTWPIPMLAILGVLVTIAALVILSEEYNVR